MVRKHLSVRSETSSDVRPLVSIGGRTSTLIFPGNKRRACEKPTGHRSTVLCHPKDPALKTTTPSRAFPLCPKLIAQTQLIPSQGRCHCSALTGPRAGGSHSHGWAHPAPSAPTQPSQPWLAPQQAGLPPRNEKYWSELAESQLSAQLPQLACRSHCSGSSGAEHASFLPPGPHQTPWAVMNR